MQIFVLDEDPKLAAIQLMVCHIVKMSLESLQLLSTAHHVLKSGLEDFKLFPSGFPTKQTHVNHPCAIWCRQSRENYLWLAEHGIEICLEYTRRYGKITLNQASLEWCKNNVPRNFPKTGRTPFAMAFSDDIINKHKGNVVEAYREFYRTKRRDPLNSRSKFETWKSNKPSWWY